MQCTTYNNNIIPQTRYTIRAREGGSATVVTATVRDSERERERGSCQGAGARSQLFIYFFITAFHSDTHTHDDARTQAHNKSHTHSGRNSRARRAIRSLYWGCCCCWCFCCFFFSLTSLTQKISAIEMLFLFIWLAFNA